MAKKEDRLFVKNGRRHYRPKYSLTEVRIGAAIGVGLVAVLAWVIYKGGHPDPDLFEAPPELLRRGEVGGLKVKPENRGPIPEEFAPRSFTAGKVSAFDASDVYKKINGREGYYKSFGFKALYFVPLTAAGENIDIELYDLGSAGNATGAMRGELPEGKNAEAKAGGLALIDRNALYLGRGPFYLRAIGSTESEIVISGLQELEETFTRVLAAGERPWSHSIMVDGLGIDSARISFTPTEAFSFEFGKRLHIARLDDDETEVFVSFVGDSAAAGLAAQYAEGFQHYGDVKGKAAGVVWVEDRYLSRVSGAGAAGPFLIGVRGAENVAAAKALYDQLATATKGIGEAARAAAAAELADAAPSTGGADEGGYE